MYEFNLTLSAILTIFCLYQFGLGLVRRVRFTQVPTLISLVYLGLILPQNFAVLVSGVIDDMDMSYLIIMQFLILFAVYLGWELAKKAGIERATEVVHPRIDKLIKNSVALMSVLGFIFYVLLSQLGAEHTGISHWTGISTIYALLVRLSYFALVASSLLWLRFRSQFYFYLLVFNSVVVVPGAFINARRESIIELGLLTLLSLFFVRRYLPSKTLLVGAIVGTSILVTSIGAVRSSIFIVDEDGYREFGNSNLSRLTDVEWELPWELSNPYYSEVGSAARIISSSLSNSQYSYGLRFWDTLIFSYIPGQFVGHGVKESLQVYEHGIPRDLGVVTTNGTVMTAFADTYEAFSFLGAGLFIFVGYIFCVFYRRALRGELLYQYLYISAIGVVLLSITHGFLVFPARVPGILLLSLPLIWAIKKTKSHRKVRY